MEVRARSKQGPRAGRATPCRFPRTALPVTPKQAEAPTCVNGLLCLPLPRKPEGPAAFPLPRYPRKASQRPGAPTPRRGALSPQLGHPRVPHELRASSAGTCPALAYTRALTSGPGARGHLTSGLGV